MAFIRTPRRARTLVPLAALALVSSVLAAAPAAALPGDRAPQAGTVAAAIPGTDEVVTSGNVTHLANLAKQGPFDSTSALGTDIAFQGRYAFAGNYNGFTTYDIADPASPKVVSQVLCPGSQNDVSVTGNLLFLSTDSSRSDDSCSSVSQSAAIKESWEGIKVFDISNKANPRYVAAVETDCGSHTHTLVPDSKGKSVYLYVSSYSPNDAFPDCKPPHDGITVVEVPLAKPDRARVVSTPVLFPDGGNPGSGSVSATSGCHDITVFPGKNLAAGACMGDGILMDISDRAAPRVIDRVRDDVNFAFWHSATFNNDATKVVFTDELGGGGGATCNAATGPNRGADGIYDLTGKGLDRKLVFRSYFKIPRHQSDSENCVAHNGSLVPVAGRDVMVQAWYQGGVSVWDFTDSSAPREIGYFERGPLPGDLIGGSWSAYWYNGHVYSSDIQKGLDVLTVDDPLLGGAAAVRTGVFNAQTQSTYRAG